MKLLLLPLFLLLLCYIYSLSNYLPLWTLETNWALEGDACNLLRGMSSSFARETECKKRICINVLSDAVYGKWRLRTDITDKDVMYRKKMDAEIRARMKVPWPESLYRNDSRLDFLTGVSPGRG